MKLFNFLHFKGVSLHAGRLLFVSKFTFRLQSAMPSCLASFLCAFLEDGY